MINYMYMHKNLGLVQYCVVVQHAGAVCANSAGREGGPGGEDDLRRGVRQRPRGG